MILVLCFAILRLCHRVVVHAFDLCDFSMISWMGSSIVSGLAGITAGGCFLIFLHFVLCAWVTMRRVGKLHRYKRINSFAYDEDA